MIRTEAQEKRIEDLTSVLDNLETEDDLWDAVIFQGDSADGPALGTIAEDGTIHWVVGEVDV